MTPMDITSLAGSLDNRLTNPPTKTEEKKDFATIGKPLKVRAKRKAMTVLIKTLDESAAKPGWTKVMATDGETRKDGGTLFFYGEKSGERTVEIVK